MTVRLPIDDAEAKIISSFKKGDQACFGQLYDKYAPLLLGVITRMLENPDLSCDCLEHSFNEIWKQKSSYDLNNERIFTWMIRIARKSALNFLDSGNGNFDLKSRTEANMGDCKGVKNNLLENSKVEDLASTADKNQKEALNLIYIRGFTFADAASKLNISVETLRTRLVLAIKQLKVTIAV